MTRIEAAKAVLTRLGISPIAAKTPAVPPVDEPDHDSDETREFRRRVRARDGRGVIVDKTV